MATLVSAITPAEPKLGAFPALLGVIPNSSPVTYSELAQAVDSARQQLDSTGLIGTQSVVSMSMINGPSFVVAFLAIGANRSVAAPLNPGYVESEVSFYLDDSKPDLLLVAPGDVQKQTEAVKAAQKAGVSLAECAYDMDGKRFKLVVVSKGQNARSKRTEGTGKPRPEDTALLLHTSGTTGRPKAVPLSHANLTRTMSNIISTYKLSPLDRSYCVMPLFHVHGLLASLLAPLASGGSVVVPPKFSATSFWTDFITTEATWYSAVPSMHQFLLKTARPAQIPPIRFIRSCSSALGAATLAEIEKEFKAPVLEAYAMTEAAHQMTSNPLPPLAHKPGSVGLPQGIELRILDDAGKDVEEGEVSIRGSNVTKGYLNNAKANKESFTEDGFFRTGDRGKLDKDGYLWLTGRIKELINRGGEKLSPIEIDGALLNIAGVGEAVSFGVPDQDLGEIVWAAVVLKEGAKLTEAEIKSAAAKHLAKFKIPVRVFITDSIPKAATGKIQRRLMAPKFQEIAKNEPARAKL